jgi:CRISPR/Cas system-associated endonuclease Cas3-HD
MLALRLLPSNASLDVKIALFFHDIGKPFCYQDVGGIRHFRGHPKVSSDITRVILKRLGYDNEYINKICYLIEKHDSFITKQEIIDDYDLAYKRYLIQKCDALAHHPDRLEKRIEYINNIKQLLKENK